MRHRSGNGYATIKNRPFWIQNAVAKYYHLSEKQADWLSDANMFKMFKEIKRQKKERRKQQ